MWVLYTELSLRAYASNSQTLPHALVPLLPWTQARRITVLVTIQKGLGILCILMVLGRLRKGIPYLEVGLMVFSVFVFIRSIWPVLILEVC